MKPCHKWKNIKHRKMIISTNSLKLIGTLCFAVQKQFLFLLQSNTLVRIIIDPRGLQCETNV